MKTLFDYLEHGEALDDFLKGFPTVSQNLELRRISIMMLMHVHEPACHLAPLMPAAPLALDTLAGALHLRTSGTVLERDGDGRRILRRSTPRHV